MTNKVTPLDHKAVALKDAFRDHPFHTMLSEVLMDLGGKDFIADWAEDNPGEFINIMVKLAPMHQTSQGGSTGPVINLNLPAGLEPGPLDITPAHVTPDD